MPLPRREFLKSALGAGLAASLPTVFSACTTSHKPEASVGLGAQEIPKFEPAAAFTFPKNFYWGTATAAYQIEGAWKDDDKGESVWDRFSHTPGKIKNGDTADTACDSFHRWREDIDLMRAMNLNSYRFSLSWPRIQPTGSGQANAKGLEYYDRLIDALLEAKIRPFVTLYHWDLPQVLEEAGGWPHRDTAGRFTDYVQLIARALGDRVTDWTLFNEPSAFTDLGYLEGIHAPGKKSLLDFLRATHTVNLAQAEGFRALKAVRPSARVGTAFNMSHCEPAMNSEADKLAAERAHAITNVWFLEPALKGRYPNALTFLPESAMKISSGDMEKIKAPLDFIGINLYYRTIASSPGALERVAHAQEWLFPVKMAGGTQGPKTDIGWEIWPQSLYEMVMRITRDYNRPTIEITENGCACNTLPGVDGTINDSSRIEYHRQYLAALAKAISEGADVRGYHAWSLIDNFEWAEGFSQRFGLSYVDYKTQKRTLKESGKWYGKLAAENVLPAALNG